MIELNFLYDINRILLIIFFQICFTWLKKKIYIYILFLQIIVFACEET